MRSAMKGVALCGIGAGLGMLGLRAIAGPLDPPAGPVSATYKTMSEVEPRIAINSVNTPGSSTAVYRITKPGSYYLTDNVDVESSKVGISIEASHVTLDLSGFQVRGTAPSLSLISIGGPGFATVCNGTVLGSGQLGIDCTGASPDVRVERVRVLGCSGGGIRLGNGAIIQNCQVE